MDAPTSSRPGMSRAPRPVRQRVIPPRAAAVMVAVAATSLLPALPLQGQEPAPAPPVSAGLDWETTQVADGIHQFRWRGHNALLISTPAGMVVVDPITPDAAEAMAGEIRRLLPGLPLHTIIYSHSDHDHAAGAPALLAAMGQGPVEIVAHERAVEPILTLNDPDLPPPSLTFSQRITLQVGGREIQLHYLGPSHTDNLIIPFVPDVGVAFAVDFVFNDRVGWRDLPGWDFDGLLQAIPGLLAIPFRTMVFGHGMPGDRGTIQRQWAYYDDLAAAVREAVARGWSEDQAAERIRLPHFSHFADYDAWLPLNVRAMHRWLTGAG